MRVQSVPSSRIQREDWLWPTVHERGIQRRMREDEAVRCEKRHRAHAHTLASESLEAILIQDAEALVIAYNKNRAILPRVASCAAQGFR